MAALSSVSCIRSACLIFLRRSLPGSGLIRTVAADLHGECDPHLLCVDLENLDIDDITDRYNFQRMLDELIGHMRDVDQAVLMDSDIYKCTEIDDIADRSLQYHAGFQVFDGQNVGTKNRLGHIFTRVTARLLQL